MKLTSNAAVWMPDNQEANEMMKNRIFKVFVIFWVLLAITIAVSVYAVNGYFDSHTWAVISVGGERNTETADAFEQEREYLKGDSISTGDISLLITDITHDGDVTFSVERGSLYTDEGESVKTDTVSKNDKKSYRTDNGYIQIFVKSSRYE